MIKKKKEFKVQLHNGYTLSYDSIEKTFKEKMQCNIFDSDFTLFSSLNESDFYLKCKINNYKSIELIMDVLNDCFSFYSLNKEKGKPVLILEGIIRKNNPFKNYLFEPWSVEPTKTFLLFFEKNSIDEEFIKHFIENSTTLKIKEIISFSIYNFKDFKFRVYDLENNIHEFNFCYEELKNINK